MIVFDARGRQVALGESVGSGGEASVYRILDQPGRLAKIYEPAPRANYASKLAWMVNHPPANPTRDLEHASLAWPDELFFDSRRQLKGYGMVHIQRTVPLLEVFNPRRRMEMLPSFDRRYLYRTARNLAAALSALHRSGYVAGDINESNVLVTSTALVTLIDTDSFQVREERNGQLILHPCPVGKPEYTPPELQGRSLAEINRVTDHDSFGLAVLIFQLLMEGSHPFRAQWLGKGDPPPLETRIARGLFPYVSNAVFPIAPPKRAPGLDTLHPWLAELFRRCFVDGHQDPRYRPGPDLWLRAIGEAEQALVCCAQGHFYASHLHGCPYCALPQRPQPAKRPNPAPRRPEPASARTAPAQRNPGWSAPPFSQPRPAGAGAGVGAAASTPGFSSPFGSWPGTGGRVAPRGFPGMGGMRGPATGVGLRGRLGLKPSTLNNWVRQRTFKSLLVGGPQGALAGAVPGALIALANWSAGDYLAWNVLFIFSAISGAMLRGWNPGYRLGALVDRYVGWRRFWQGVGLATGAVVGTLFGLVFIWAIIPVFLGLILGAQSGKYLGSKIYQVGSFVGWERIWGGLSAISAAALGWGVANLAGSLGMNAVGEYIVEVLFPYSGNGSLTWALVWTVAGGMAGGLAGMLSGIVADLMGRLTGLVD